MSKLEERLIARWPASRYLAVGIAVAALGYLPLQLYIAFGPSDGNPIGLGLLALVALPLGLAIFVIGLLKLAIAYLVNPED